MLTALNPKQKQIILALAATSFVAAVLNGLIPSRLDIFQYLPGIIYGTLLCACLARFCPTTPPWRVCIVGVASALSYFCAYRTARESFNATEHHMNGDLALLLSFTIAGIVGATIFVGGFQLVYKLFSHKNYAQLVLLGGVLGAIGYELARIKLFSDEPTWFLLFAVWQVGLGGTIGYFLSRRV